jgi:hypothetical protein
MCYITEACRNYAIFHELPPEAVAPEQVCRSFGGLKGWAAVTRKGLYPECLRELEDLLAESPWRDRRLQAVSEENKRRLRRGRPPSSLSNSGARGRSSSDDLLQRRGEEAPPPVECREGGGAWEEQLRLVLPTFSLAKEGYERFKGLAPGQASLREVLYSSAGVEGWQAFSRALAAEPAPAEEEEPAPSPDSPRAARAWAWPPAAPSSCSSASP